MGPFPPSGGLLWYIKTAAPTHGSEALRRGRQAELVSGAPPVERFYVPGRSRKGVTSVCVRPTSSRPGGGCSLPAEEELPCGGYEKTDDTGELRKDGDVVEDVYCTSVSAYEDTVAVLIGGRVYVGSSTCLGQKFRSRSNWIPLWEYMQLAIDDETFDSVLPLTEVLASPELVPSLESVVSVACGAEHLLLCTSIGRLYSAGSNSHGQLGRGDAGCGSLELGPVDFVDETSGKEKRGSCGPAAIEVYAGSNFSFALARKRSLAKEAGFSSFLSSKGSTKDAPSEAGRKPCASRAESASRCTRRERTRRYESGFSLARYTSDCVPFGSPASNARHTGSGNETHPPVGGGKGDALYSWGCNDYGQLGHGTKEPAMKPVQVKLPKDVSCVKSVAAGFAHVAVLTATNTVYSCGLNLHGQLGLETIREGTRLRKVILSEAVEQISCGTWHTLFLTSSGQVLTAGRQPAFPYAAWLQSGVPTHASTQIAIRDGTGLKSSATTDPLQLATGSMALDGDSSTSRRSPQTSAGKIELPPCTSDFHAEAEGKTGSTALLAPPQHILLSTTRHYRRSSNSLNTALQPGSSASSGRGGMQEAEDTPFARAPGILCVNGFLGKLSWVSAGQATSAAVGLDKSERRYLLYVWKVRAHRAQGGNLSFTCEIYDASALLNVSDDTERLNVECCCAPSGVYLWAKTSRGHPSNSQS